MDDYIITWTEKGSFICEYTHNPYINRAVEVVEDVTIHKERVNGFERTKSIEENSTITFEMKDGSTVRHDVPKEFSSVYMRQYGIDVSEDGKYYFLHDWYARGGLSCYEVDTGKLHWRVKIKHTREAFVCREYILCFFENSGILKIKIESGEIIERYAFRNNGDFCRISKDCFIIGQKRNHYIIINAEGVGDSANMAKRIEEATGIETRATIIGHIQRGGSPTARDRVMASLMGAKAVDLLAEGKSKRVVGFRDGKLVDYEVNEALAMSKTLDPYMWDVSQRLSRL